MTSSEYNELLGNIAQEVGHTPGFLLSEIEKNYPEGFAPDWRNNTPRVIIENWHNLSAETRLVALCIACRI